MPNSFLFALVFIFGACIGSFLNVCIHRLPLQKSLVFPGSACPVCSKYIRFYDNIPLISYVMLKGRCRYCDAFISPRYLLVELLTGLFAIGVFIKFGITLTALIYFAFIAALLVVAFIDITHRIIPDVITLPGIAICFLASFCLPLITFMDSLWGLLGGGGLLLAIAWIYRLLTHKDGMGGGDIKLLAMIGALIGLKGVFFTVFVSSATGTLVGVLTMLRTNKGMKLAIPFGPFLALGAIVYLFFGPQLIYWYVHLLR